MSNVSFVPSTGLGALIGLMRSLKKEGHRFILVGLQPEVRTALAVTHLDKLLEIHTSLEDSLNRLHSET
jgi:anti-anti-sigma factor